MGFFKNKEERDKKRKEQENEQREWEEKHRQREERGPQWYHGRFKTIEECYDWHSGWAYSSLLIEEIKRLDKVIELLEKGGRA